MEETTSGYASLPDSRGHSASPGKVAEGVVQGRPGHHHPHSSQHAVYTPAKCLCGIRW